jgi:hypothetical protein
MQALLYADQTRRFLDEQNAARAAYAAMQAGAFGGDLLSDAERVRAPALGVAHRRPSSASLLARTSP